MPGGGTAREQCRARAVGFFSLAAPAGRSHETDRYRLGLSDGQLWGTAMLATQHNHLVKDNVIKVGTMLRLDDYLVNEMQGRK